MDIDQIPLFAMIKAKLGHTNQRLALITENVANADTPAYRPRDLNPFSFDDALKSAQMAEAAAPTRATPGQIDLGVPNASLPRPVDAPDSEVKLDGNSVVLEEQMMKLNDAEGDYDAAIGFYQRSLALLNDAIRKPGG